MTTFIVDANVALMWYLPENLSVKALLLHAADFRLVAPDYLLIEAGSVLARMVRRRQLNPQDGWTVILALRHHPLTYRSANSLLEPAYEFSNQLGLSFYDALYLALAVQEQGILVTDDRKLLKAVKGSPASGSATWVGNLK